MSVRARKHRPHEVLVAGVWSGTFLSAKGMPASVMLSTGHTLPSIFDPRFEALVDELLSDYYFSVTNQGLKRFTGAHFDTLGGEWHELSTSNVITAVDLAAVSCLSVKIPGEAAVRLLERQAQTISDLLTAMPSVEESLWEVSEHEVLNAVRPASQLWQLLRGARDGLGPTTTSKIMARKRANLIPVFDTVVQEALGLSSSEGHWATMRRLMQTKVEDRELHERLADSAGRVGVDAFVTPLRAFDVAVWYGYNPRPRVQSRVQKIQDRLMSEARMELRWAPRPK